MVMTTVSYCAHWATTLYTWGITAKNRKRLKGTYYLLADDRSQPKHSLSANGTCVWEAAIREIIREEKYHLLVTKQQPCQATKSTFRTENYLKNNVRINLVCFFFCQKD